MKRLLAFLLLTVLLLSCVSCASAPEESGTDTQSDTEGLFYSSDSDVETEPSTESEPVSSSASETDSAIPSTDPVSQATDSQTPNSQATDSDVVDSSTSTHEKITISTVTVPGYSEDAPSTSNTPPPDPIPNKLMAMTDQKNDEIIVVNLDSADITSGSAIVWRWSTSTKGDVTHANLCRSRLDDVRLRDSEAWGGKVVGLTSSSGMVALVKYPSGECLFSANMQGYGPHSIEILPNGVIAVAGSGNGNDAKAVVRLYSATSKNDTNFVELPLISAHGVLWDPENEVLWALGHTELNAYTVGGTRQKPTLTLKKTAKVGFSGGHDLSPVYGNTDLLWVTYGGGVGQYSKSQDRFLVTYEGKLAINLKGVKSINTYADGVTVMTVADPNNKTANHDTDKVRIFRYVQNSSGVWQYRFNDISFNAKRDFYKVRAFVADYQ